MTLKKLYLAGVLLVAIATAVALHVDFDAPELGRSVLGRTSEATGIALDADRFRLNLLEGLTLEGVESSGSFPGARYRIEIERLVLTHRLLPLLKGEPTFERVVIERPVIEVVTGVKRNVPPASAVIAIDTASASAESDSPEGPHRDRGESEP